MIVLFDIDSLLYSSSYGQESAADACNKLDEVYQSIINKIEDYHPIHSLINVGLPIGENFRVKLDKNYKANRKTEKPEFYKDVCDYAIEHYDLYQPRKEEADDLVARLWRQLTDIGEKVIIVSIDKDYKQLPCLLYDYHYKRDGLYQISEEEALRNFFTQMIVGDTADNVNYLKGYGPKKAESILEGADSVYKYTRRVYTLFKEMYPSAARERFKTCHRLLKIG